MTFAWTSHRFVGGALALDVANSVILRADPARRIDRFAEPAQLRAFPEAVRAFCAERALFGALTPVKPLDEPAFLRLREAIDRYFRARVAGIEDDALLADLLDAAASALRGPHPPSLAAETAHSALRLLHGETATRLKICGHCGWLFIDRSKNRSRAWCDMAVCGNRAKARRYYDRRREAPP